MHELLHVTVDGMAYDSVLVTDAGGQLDLQGDEGALTELQSVIVREITPSQSLAVEF